MTSDATKERRYPRYPVSGPAQLWIAGQQTPGQLLTISIGGALIRTDAAPPARGTELRTEFQIEGHPQKFDAPGRVVYTQSDVIALMFLGQPAGLDHLLAGFRHEA